MTEHQHMMSLLGGIVASAGILGRQTDDEDMTCALYLIESAAAEVSGLLADYGDDPDGGAEEDPPSNVVTFTPEKVLREAVAA